MPKPTFDPLLDQIVFHDHTGELDSRYLLLNQTTPQIITGGAPIFDGGLKTRVINAKDATGLSLFDDANNGIFVRDGGNVGIGTTNPTSHLQITGDGTLSGGSITLENDYLTILTANTYNDIPSTSPQWSAKRARGTKASPLAVTSNDRLGMFSFNGHDGTDLNTVGGALSVYVDGSVTTDSVPVRFSFEGIKPGKTLRTTHLMIRSSGNVGIGTTSPSNKLHVYGNQTLEGSAEAYLRFTDSGGSPSDFYAGINYDAAPNLFTIGNGATDTPYLTINSSGNVGIGTTNPVFGKLEIYGNGSNTRLAIHEDAGTNIAGLSLRSGTRDWYIDSQEGVDFRIYRDTESPYLTIGETGNVGIGTTAPSTKLDIGAGAMTLEAMTAPSSPASDKAVLFLEATGTSPSRTVALKVKWQDGSTSTLASVTV